jgi:SAM-dependent methyltransferase
VYSEVEEVNVVTEVLEHPRLYEFWQLPFAHRKLAPVLRHNDVAAARRVLDIACGPGTNARYFSESEYLGVDINPRYVSYARRRYGREFLAADVLAAGSLSGAARYDFVLVNSFLHHLDDHEVAEVLRAVRGLLAADGRVHILELVLPASAGPARLLARWDRGKHARPVECWQELLAAYLAVDVCEPFVLDVFGIPLWQMVYLRGQLA